VFQPLVI